MRLQTFIILATIVINSLASEENKSRGTLRRKERRHLGNHNNKGEISIPMIGKTPEIASDNLQNNPPYWGTIFVDGSVIMDSDPTSLERIEKYNKNRCVNMYDRCSDEWVQSDDNYIFDATFSDGIKTQFWVRGSDFTSSEAEVQVLKYAKVLGRVPQFLRMSVRVVTLLAGDCLWGGNEDGLVLFHTDYDYSNLGDKGDPDITDEVVVHEAAHIVDPFIYGDTKWDDVVQADGKYISQYAKNYPYREDVAESLVIWLGVKLGTLNAIDQQITKNQIPNRLAYFDDKGYNVYPLGDGTSGKVPGYSWEKLRDYYYDTSNCAKWDGVDAGTKRIIYKAPKSGKGTKTKKVSKASKTLKSRKGKKSKQQVQ